MVFILVSLKKEIDFFLDMLKDLEKKRSSGFVCYQGTLHEKEVIVIGTGMGKKEIDPELLRSSRFVISTGFCGALVPELKTGDVVLSTEVVYGDAEYTSKIYRDERIKELIPEKTDVEITAVSDLLKMFIKKIRNKDISTYSGRTITVEKAIKRSKEKAQLHSATGAIAVDMEDYFRLKLAQKINTHFLSVRSVLDEVQDEIPSFKSRFKIGSELYSLLRNISSARVSIALSLEKILPSLPNL